MNQPHELHVATVRPEDAAQFIRASRIKRGWTQQTLADKVGINVETILRAEKARPVKLLTLNRIIAELPDDPASTTASVEPEKDLAAVVNELATRIGYLLQGLRNEERLHRIRLTILGELREEAEQDLREAELAAKVIAGARPDGQDTLRKRVDKSQPQ